MHIGIGTVVRHASQVGEGTVIRVTRPWWTLRRPVYLVQWSWRMVPVRHVFGLEIEGEAE